jgi:hypothetical protein
MFGDESGDQANPLGLPDLFLILRPEGVDPVIYQPDPSPGPPQEGKNEMVFSKVNPQAGIKNYHKKFSRDSWANFTLFEPSIEWRGDSAGHQMKESIH